MPLKYVLNVCLQLECIFCRARGCKLAIVCMLQQWTRKLLDSPITAAATTSCPALSDPPLLTCAILFCLQDIIETKDAFELHCDAPGFSPADISVEMAEGMLTISGKRKEVKQEEREGKVRGLTGLVVCNTHCKLSSEDRSRQLEYRSNA